LSFAEQLAIMGSGNFNREANIFRNATMTNMINPVGNRYNDITDFYLVRNRKASLEDVLAHQCLPDESPFHSISGLPYNNSKIYHEDPRFPYSRMQRSGSHFHPNSGNIQSHGDRQSRHFPFSRKATGRNMGSQAYHDNTILKYLEMPFDNADRNGVDSLELVNVIGRVNEVRQVFSFFSLLIFF
jgi:pumilio RNA-binding family